MSSLVSHSLEGEFECVTLSNKDVSLSLIPELGGRVVSIIDRRNGREWLDGWAPASERRLWHPSDPTQYDSSPGAGLDECLPTVLPCQWSGNQLPDHGELWRTAPKFNVLDDELICAWRLACLPLAFRRSIHLEDDTITMSYRLENLSREATPFQWAWHALLKLQEGDVIQFDKQPATCRTPDGEIQPWPEAIPSQDLSRAETGDADPPWAKVFLGPFAKGFSKIQGISSSLELNWPGELFPWAGVWISRGAWKGLHHWAIEPTNGPFDRLSELPSDPLSRLEGKEIREWEILLRLTN